MGEQTAIAWTHHTFNPWIGCAKVAPGCTHCYAEAYAHRYGKAVWGAGGTRVKTSDAYWRQPLKWNREAAAAGERRRVFCASLADVFEDWFGPILDSRGEQVRDHKTSALIMADMRRMVFALIDQTPHLDWLLLTKRPENIRRMWPTVLGENARANWAAPDDALPSHPREYRGNVWLLASVSDQPTYDVAAARLWQCRALCPVLGFSAEPLLHGFKVAHPYDGEKVRNWGGCWDWIIVGGESGPDRRDCGVAAIVSVVDQCRAAGVPCFVKQDCAYRSGERGRLPADVWAVKEFPATEGTP